MIVDPYGTGLHTFHGELRTDGFFMNGKQAPGGEPVEYDFQKSPVLQVPEDWNTQRESLFYYEGDDFDLHLKPGSENIIEGLARRFDSRRGAVSGEKKEAFYILQAFYKERVGLTANEIASKLTDTQSRK
jgi:hypothetical protein